MLATLMLLSTAILTPIRVVAEAKVARINLTPINLVALDSDVHMALLDCASYGHTHGQPDCGLGGSVARCYYCGKPDHFSK